MTTEGEGSRARLLAAGKMLFAKLGYEQTSTATIAREAGTSESQLVRYFGGKAGLLETIFNESWTPLNEDIQTLVAGTSNARDAMLAVVAELFSAFARDPEVAYVFFFEGRRVRGSAHEVFLSKGFRAFADLMQRLIMRGQEEGALPRDLPPAAVGSALLGAVEGMIRDRLIARRAGRPGPFADADIRRVFAAILEGLSAPAASRR